MKKTLLAASLSVAFFLSPAEAGVFDFSFTLSDNRVLSGKAVNEGGFKWNL
jgi:hypothetical protein